MVPGSPRYRSVDAVNSSDEEEAVKTSKRRIRKPRRMMRRRRSLPAPVGTGASSPTLSSAAVAAVGSVGVLVWKTWTAALSLVLGSHTTGSKHQKNGRSKRNSKRRLSTDSGYTNTSRERLLLPRSISPKDSAVAAWSSHDDEWSDDLEASSHRPSRRGIRPRTVISFFLELVRRIFLLSIASILIFAAILTFYMAFIRDLPPISSPHFSWLAQGVPPTSHHIPIASPFSRAVCYADQLRLLATTVVSGKDIKHREECSEEVLEAILEGVREWPPKARGGVWKEVFVNGEVCEDGEGGVDGGEDVVEAFLAGRNVTGRRGEMRKMCRPNVEWVVYATSCSRGLNRLAKSLKKGGIPLTVLGMGMGWRGWGQRVRSYHDYLVALTEHGFLEDLVGVDLKKKVLERNRRRVVVFSDGDDVIANCGGDEIVERFWGRSEPWSRVVFAAERAIWPRREWEVEYRRDVDREKPVLRHLVEGVRDPRKNVRPLVGFVREAFPDPVDTADVDATERAGEPLRKDTPSLFRFLNAGTFMGAALDVRELLKSVYVDECFDDQQGFSRAFLDGVSAAVGDLEGMMKVEGLVREVEVARSFFDGEVMNWVKGGQEAGREEPVLRAWLAVREARRRLKRASVEHNLRESDREIDLFKRVGDVKALVETRPFIALDYENHFASALYDVWIGDMGVMRDNSTSSLWVRMKETQPTLRHVPHAPVPAEVMEMVEKEVSGNGFKGVCAVHHNGRKIENRALEKLSKRLGLAFDSKAVLVKGFE
ncbi:hypothetical protein HDU97_002191 [Phlyctochytrium planicorne]|nr:hypothetical protein HDU97_002191 [Phlyctochytrium planicorne]